MTGPPNIVFYCGATVMSDDGKLVWFSVCLVLIFQVLLLVLYVLLITNHAFLLTNKKFNCKSLPSTAGFATVSCYFFFLRRVYPLIVMGSTGTLPSQIEAQKNGELSLQDELGEVLNSAAAEAHEKEAQKRGLKAGEVLNSAPLDNL